jgi:ParB family chromosome partitioning protein
VDDLEERFLDRDERVYYESLDEEQPQFQFRRQGQEMGTKPKVTKQVQVEKKAVKKVEKSAKKKPATAAKKPTSTPTQKPAAKLALVPASIIQIPIKDIVADAEANVRYFKEDPKLIEHLAESIKRDGVIEPLIVRATEELDTYGLIAGYRRLKAAKEAGLKVVPCIVRDGVDDQMQLRISLTENIQRKNLSPMEFAMNCKRVRGEFAWEGETNTKKVAQFMGVSAATITQMEKLLVLKPEHQRMIHERALGAQAGQDIADIVKEFGAEKAAKVLAKAVEIEEEEQERKATKKSAKQGKVKPSEAGRAARAEKKEREGREEKDDKGGKKGAVVSQRSVRKAAKSEKAVIKHARNIKDLMEIFEVCLDGDSEPLKKVAQAVIDWQKGEIGDEELIKVLGVTVK